MWCVAVINLTYQKLYLIIQKGFLCSFDTLRMVVWTWHIRVYNHKLACMAKRIHVCVCVCANSSICLPMCAQRFACVHVCYDGRGQPALSSLMCLGGPRDSRALEGVDVSALRDL